MKKFLAVLLAVAMVMSLIPTMAFAADDYNAISWVVVTKDEAQNYFQFATGIEVAEGDKIELIMRSDLGVIKGDSSYRYYANTDYSSSANQVGRNDESTVEAIGNGWYKVTIDSAEAEGLLVMRLYFEGQENDKITGTATVEIAEIKVGDTPAYTFASADDITAAGLAEWVSMVPTFSIGYHEDAVSVVTITKDEAENYFQFQADQINLAVGDTVQILVHSTLGAVKTSSSIRTLVGNGSIDETGRYTPEVFEIAEDWYVVSAEVTAAGVLAARFYFEGQSDKITGEVSIDIAEIYIDDDNFYHFEIEGDIEAAGLKKWTSMTPSFAIGVALLDLPDPVFWPGYVMPAKSSNRNTIFVEGTFTTGDVVSFLVFIGESSDVNKTDMYVRKSAKALYLGTNEEVYSGNHIVDFALPLLDEGEETGWYYIECVLQEDSTKLEFSVDGGNVSDGNLGENIITCIAVNGELLDDTVVVTDNSGNPVTPEELDATGVELPEREALQLIVTGEGATVVVKDYEGTEVEPGEEALTEKYQYTVDVEVAEGYELLGILVNGKEFRNGDSFIASESVEITVSTLQKFEADITAENATVVVKDAEGNPIEGEIEAGTAVVVDVEVAEGYEIVSVTVNGEAYEVGTEIIVTDGLVIEVITAEETTDVEPTGAISAVVVAIAAVIGGAVVLKKREF